MSDDERGLSDDDGADLFESDPEDHDGKVDNSLALPSLSFDSFYIKSPLQSERAEYENSGCEDGGGGIVVSEAPSSPAHSEGRGLEFYGQEDNASAARDDGNDPADGALETYRCNRNDSGVPSKKDDNRSEDRAVTQFPTAIAPCDSPKLPNCDDHQQTEANEMPLEQEEPDNGRSFSQTGHLENDDTYRSAFHHTPRVPPSMKNSTNMRDTSEASAGKTVHFEHDDSVSLPAASEEPAESSRTEVSHYEDTIEQSTPDKTSYESLQEPSIHDPPYSNSPEKATKQPVYTVEALFPVVYESNVPPAKRELAQVMPISSTSTNTKKPTWGRRARNDDNNPDKTIASRFAALQAQLDVAKSELANATRTFKLQLSLVESDNKKLSGRNARLKTQLSLTNASLQRSNAKMMKLKTENEIYAAKLPRLQAELLEETSQVDETQAQSVRTQLILTQLKARSHVLQTRAHSLETQNNKLTQQFRECQRQLKRKTAALQQQTEKSHKIEVDLNDLKNVHTQEKLDWKNRLSTTLQRFEHDKIELEIQLKATERKEVREAKGRADKAAKKRRAAEATTAKLEEQLKQCKHELASANDSVQRRTNEVRTLEALLRKAHRTEAALRNDLAVCKTRLRSFQDEKKRSMARFATVQTRRQRLEHQIPVEMLLHLTDSSDDEAEQDNQVKESCSPCFSLSKDQSPPSPCTECLHLKDQLQQLQQELRRLRSLHATELHAQASVLDVLLQNTKESR